MGQIFIRAASEKDLAGIQNLMKRLSEIAPVNSSEALQAIWREIEATSSMSVFVATDGDTIIGTITLNVVLNPARGARPYGLVENVSVDVDYRRRGIGLKLMQQVQTAAQAARCHKLTLLGGRRDPSVYAFYEACGFSGDVKSGFELAL